MGRARQSTTLQGGDGFRRAILGGVKIAVVIPALDESEQIAGAIESTRLHAPSGGALDGEQPDLEVWVVDGGSSDGTPERARGAGAQVMQSTPGRARQLDRGWRASSAEVVVFLHADSRLPGNWAASIGNVLADPAVVGGAFRLGFDASGALFRVVEWVVRARVFCFGLPYGDQAIFVRRRILEAIGGVPSAIIMEDLDLIREMKGRGRLALLPARVTTSARRYRDGGVWRTLGTHAVALMAWRLGVGREWIAGWCGR